MVSEFDRENETHKILWDIEIQTDHLIPDRKPGLVLIKKDKRTCHLVDFTVPTDHGVKIKGSEMIDKYLDLAREEKKLCNMNLMETPARILRKALGRLAVS